MNTLSKSITINSDFDFSDAMSDIAARFADSPVHRIGFDITAPEIERLALAYGDRVFRARRNAADGELEWQSVLLRFDDDSFLLALADGYDHAEIYARTDAVARALYADVADKLARLRPADRPFFYMLRHEYRDFLTERIEHLPEDPGDEFLRLCYGDDILKWLGQFADRTMKRTGGLTIFEGMPGTGKTSLVSLMIRRLDKSHVFYVLPTSQDSTLSAPELVSFWQTQNNRHPDRVKVIVIEDAERLLWPRSGDNREAVSAILNIADGLIGRMLRLHILCSVNARLADLDPAVMRPGRLMNYRVFRPLSRSSAERIAALQSRSFTAGKDRNEFTLAEVLNENSTSAPLRKDRIGFGQ